MLFASSPLCPTPLHRGLSQWEGEIVKVRTDSPCHFYLTGKQELVGDAETAGPSGMSPGDGKMGVQDTLGVPPRSEGTLSQRL